MIREYADYHDKYREPTEGYQYKDRWVKLCGILLLLVALAFDIVAVATDWWFEHSIGNGGLWEVCTSAGCDTIDSGDDDDVDATRALMLLSIIFAGLALLVALTEFYYSMNDRYTGRWATAVVAVFAALAVLFAFIGMIVYQVAVYEDLDDVLLDVEHAYSFWFIIPAVVLFGLASILFAYAAVSAANTSKRSKMSKQEEQRRIYDVERDYARYTANQQGPWARKPPMPMDDDYDDRGPEFFRGAPPRRSYDYDDDYAFTKPRRAMDDMDLARSRRYQDDYDFTRSRRAYDDLDLTRSKRPVDDYDFTRSRRAYDDNDFTRSRRPLDDDDYDVDDRPYRRDFDPYARGVDPLSRSVVPRSKMLFQAPPRPRAPSEKYNTTLPVYNYGFAGGAYSPYPVRRVAPIGIPANLNPVPIPTGVNALAVHKPMYGQSQRFGYYPNPTPFNVDYLGMSRPTNRHY